MEEAMSHISLRPITSDDTDLIVKWRNNPAVKQNLLSQDLITNDTHKDYYNKQILTGLIRQFIILCSEYTDIEAVPIGTVLLKNIDTQNHNCELGIFIGERASMGKGYGSQAINLLLDYGFTQLKMHKIYLKVLPENSAAIHLYKKLGFLIEADFREEYARDSAYINVLQMSILKKEFMRNK